jgi:hypothetical protein
LNEEAREELMVDFSRKPAEEGMSEAAPTDSQDPDAWVEYVDDLGRTRACRKRDLPTTWLLASNETKTPKQLPDILHYDPETGKSRDSAINLRPSFIN